MVDIEGLFKELGLSNREQQMINCIIKGADEKGERRFQTEKLMEELGLSKGQFYKCIHDLMLRGLIFKRVESKGKFLILTAEMKTKLTLWSKEPEKETVEQKSLLDRQVDEIFSKYVEITKRVRYPLTNERRNAIRRCIKERDFVSCYQAMFILCKRPWNNGDNPSKTKYLDIVDHIFKKGARVDEILGWVDQAGLDNMRSKMVRDMEAKGLMGQ